MFRTFMVAVLSVLALSSVGAGVAAAATPLPATADCVQVLNSETKCNTSTSTSADAKISKLVISETDCKAKAGDWRWVNGHCVPDRDRGPVFGHGSGPIFGGTYHGPVYRDCNDARGHGYYNVRRGDSRFNDAWDRNRDGVACDDGDLVIVDSDGDCTTYATARDSVRNYSLAYNRYRTTYHGNLRGMNVRDRDDLNRLYSLQRGYENRGWNSTKLSNLRTVCKDTSPTVTIINEAPPAVAPVTMTQSAPAPTYTAPAPQVSTVPSGGAETGGQSEAFLAG